MKYKKTCPQCHNIFIVDTHINKSQKHCSKRCSNSSRAIKGKKSVFICQWCKKEFKEWAYRKPSFCSSQCRSEFAARQPKPKKRRPENFLKKQCVLCGKDFIVHKVFDTNGRTASYCSVTCKLRSRISSPERKCKEILENLKVPFLHQVLIKPNFYVDFIVFEKVVLQVDGEYWHGHERFNPLTDRQLQQRKRDEAQTAYLRKCGYKVIRVWESDVTIKNIKRIISTL